MDLIAAYPQNRMRRMRDRAFSRSMMQETQLGARNLIQPFFLLDQDKGSEEINAMPGVKRLGLDAMLHGAERCLELGIPAVILFPVVPTELKSLDAREAYNEDGLMQRRVRVLKERFPELGVMTDVALDPFTTHGMDGLMNAAGHVLNDETVTVLKRQALSHAAAGADVIAPSDMMDGRIGAIRHSLDEHAFTGTQILAYSAKYASKFYGPFRDAVGSSGNLQGRSKAGFQLDPANSEEAMRETALDIAEGADMVLIKPGLPYLDIIYRVKQKWGLPTFAYHVSGEYSMLKAAAAAGYLDEKACALETLLAFRRAGCDGIITYYATTAAGWLRDI